MLCNKDFGKRRNVPWKTYICSGKEKVQCFDDITELGSFAESLKQTHHIKQQSVI